MATMNCDICGGRVVATEKEGWFACDSCGMDYPLEWVKAKFQKTQTVKLEGTVKVEGQASVENLYRRGQLLLEDGKWDEAGKCFDKILEIDAEHHLAYIGKLCVDTLAHSESELVSSKYLLSLYPNFQKAVRFADADCRERLDGFKKANQDRVEKAKQALLQKYERYAKLQLCISIGWHHIVGLRIDGVVVAAGQNDKGQCNTQSWRDVIAVSAGWGHTVGLKANGTVVATGCNENGECNIQNWRDIIAVSAGWGHTVGLKKDGTVCAIGKNGYGQCNTRNWNSIVAIAVGCNHTVGLEKDGTVVSVGRNECGEGNVRNWRNIVAISAGSFHTCGLMEDGTVVAVGEDGQYGQCDTGDWWDIIAVSSGGDYIVGLKETGDVVVAGKAFNYNWGIEKWWDIVAVSASGEYAVGLKTNGTIISTLASSDGIARNIRNWQSIGPSSEVQRQKRRQEDQKNQEIARQQQEKQSLAWTQQGLCKYCGGKLSAFGKKCKACGKQN